MEACVDGAWAAGGGGDTARGAGRPPPKPADPLVGHRERHRPPRAAPPPSLVLGAAAAGGAPPPQPDAVADAERHCAEAAEEGERKDGDDEKGHQRRPADRRHVHAGDGAGRRCGGEEHHGAAPRGGTGEEDGKRRRQGAGEEITENLWPWRRPDRRGGARTVPRVQTARAGTARQS
ncbi:hypothetical protein BU14_2208s0001, partial [Porphyra umbilicalis]